MLVYATEKCARTFQEDLTLHLLHGYVFSTPEVFIMGRPVRRNAEHRLITDPTVEFFDPDCWLVHLAAGDIRQFFRYEPYSLPWLCWQRANKLRFYNRRNVAKMLGGGRSVRGADACRCPAQLRPTEQGAVQAPPTPPAETAVSDHCCREFAEAQSTGLDVPQAGICQYDPHERSWHSIERAIGS
jgi:hypothetical protein